MRFHRDRTAGQHLEPIEAALRHGERVLVTASTADGGTAAASTHALHVTRPDGAVQTTRYVEILSARWDPDAATLHLVTVAGPALLRMAGESLLPETVRERVQSSIVLSQRVSARGRGGATVVARRVPGEEQLSWQIRYDGNADPDDPALSAQVEAMLAELRAQAGESAG